MALVTDKQALAIGGIALVAGYLIWRKSTEVAAQVIDAVDPTSSDNVFHKGANALATEITGDPNALQSVADHFFGALDLANPWAPKHRKNYARAVWGVGNN